MRKRILSGLFALTIALSGVLTTAAPAQAYAWTGTFWTNSVFSDNKITICFQAGTPVYTHRETIASGVRWWDLIWNVSIQSTGGCDGAYPWNNDPTELRVVWSHQQAGCGLNTPTAWMAPVAGGTSKRTMFFNAKCHFNWSTGIPGPTQWDVETISAHETGHAHGLAHTLALGRQLMDEGMDVGEWCHKGISSDDFNGLKNRYPGRSFTGLFVTPQMNCPKQ